MGDGEKGERKPGGVVRVGIGGGSGAGKSVVADLMRAGLRPRAVAVVRLDRFFQPTDRMPTYYSRHHREARLDFNRPDSLNEGAMVDFCSRFTDAEIAIFEGHYALFFPALRDLMDIRCYVESGGEEMLERRTRRNLAAGYGGDEATIRHYNRECVLPRFREFIEPTKEYADFVIPNHESRMADRDRVLGQLCERVLRLLD